ncbi:RidA family protein [Salsipaludibacter albus]|uniref:RidA family protein n=1 Tax=Salsipaludibacter albus TaxID=2849650 RepID=UPI001EE47870|nr:RidA family protein [Salsipaludibacter albus]MBY5163412.1 RidA family protein [Salsipaludibacter albus]
MTTGPRHHVSSGSTFEEQVGYSRAVYDDDTVWVAGTTGFDYATMTIADDVVDQCRTTLDNVAQALAPAGAGLDDVVRVRYLLVDADDFPPCWPVLREAFAVARPAATMLVVAGLADPRMRIEIEATARRPRPGAA